MPVAGWIGPVIDCADPARLAAFWSAVLGGSVDERTATTEWISLTGIGGAGYVSFQRVPEAKAVKNRVHLDLRVDDLERAVAQAESLGATRVGEPIAEPTNTFQVMLDPEGNEFCLIVAVTRQPG